MNGKPNIVIADDEIHILRVLELKFTSAGFEIFRAHDGLQAWQEVIRSQPSLVVTDYQMPVMNGVELAQKMFEDEQLRLIPVILLTARGFYLDSDDLSKTNIIQIISKPFSPRELLAFVSSTLSSEASQGR